MSASRRLLVVALVALLAAACGSSSSSPATSPSPDPSISPPSGSAVPAARPVVVDTDLGADDIVAIAYLAAAPGVDLRAVTVSGTGLAHCSPGVANARAILALLDRAEVPVACGRERPLTSSHAFPEDWRKATDGAYGLDLPGTIGAPKESAVEVLRAAIAAAASPVSVLVLGPATNLAETLAAHPDLRARVASITFMGGAITSPGNVAGAGVADDNGTAEWNVFIDPGAWQALLDSGIPVTVVPLDATQDVPLTRGLYLSLAANRTAPAARLAFDLFDGNPFLLTSGQSLWDELAAVTLVDPSVVTLERTRIRVVTEPGRHEGRTAVEPAGVDVAVATGTDEARFRATLVSTLNGGAAIARAPDDPPTIRLAFDGTTCRAEVPPNLAAGFVAVELTNTSEADVSGGIARLAPLVTPEEFIRRLESDPATAETLGTVEVGASAGASGRGREIGVMRAGEHVTACALYEPVPRFLGVEAFTVRD